MISRKGLTGIIKGQTRALAEQVAAQVATKASTLLMIAPYALAAAAVIGLTVALIGAVTSHERHIKQLKEEKKQLEILSNQYVQSAKSLESLKNEYKEAYLAGEDLLTVQQKLIDSYPEIAQGIDLTTGSLEQNIKALDKEILKIKESAAANAIAAIEKSKELFEEEKKDNLNNAYYAFDSVVENGILVNKVIVYDSNGQKFGEFNSYDEAFDAYNKSLGDFSPDAVQVNAVVDYAVAIENSKGLEVSDVQKAALQRLYNSGDLLEEIGKDEEGNPIYGLIDDFEERVQETYEKVGEEADKLILKYYKLGYAGEEAAQKADEALSKWYNGSTSFSGEEIDVLSGLFNIDERLEDKKKEISERANELGKEIGFDLSKGIESVIEIGGTSGAEAFLNSLFEKIKDPEQAKKFAEAVTQLAASDSADLSNGITTITFDQLLNSMTDSTSAFNALQEIYNNFSTEKAKEQIEALTQAINFNEVDLEAYVNGPLKDYLSSVEKLKGALNDGLEIADFGEFYTQFSDQVDFSSFYFDEFTGKIYGSEEAMIQLAEAIRAKKLEEYQATLITLDETIALKENQIATNDASIDKLKFAINQGIATAATYESISALQAENKVLRGEVDGLKTQYDATAAMSEVLKSTTLSQNYLKGSIDETSDAIEKQIDTLEKQKEALEEARDSAKDYADMLAEAIKNRLNDELDYYQNAVENYYDALDQALQELIDNAQNSLDALKDKADSLEDLADKDAEALQEQADAVINFYDAQIGAIQAKIDALNNESDALERLQKIQEARDAYEQAKQKTRLVLVEGAGWRFKTDKNALSEAGQELATAEQENQAELLQKQIDQLEEIKSKWEQIAENIGKATSELEEQAKFQEYLNGASPEDLDNLYNQFVNSVGQNNNLYENALQAQNQYGQQNDSTVEGTLAWQILQWQKAQEQAEKDRDQFDILTDPNAKAVDDLKKQLLSQLGSASSGGINNALNKGLEIIGNSAEKVNAINATLDALEELINKMDMTSEEIAQYNSIQSLVGQAQLEALLQGGSIYNQLESEINGIISLNDQIEDLNIQIEALNESQEQTKAATEEFKNRTNEQLNSLSQLIQNAGNQISNAVKSSGGRSQQSVSMYSNGGLVDYTGPAKVHGQRNRPEMVLNNSQSAGLFKFIDSLVTGFTLPMSSIPFGKQNQSIQEESTTFSNCSFEIKTDANNFEQLIQEIKQKAPFKRKS